jgi:hypothetical protein
MAPQGRLQRKQRRREKQNEEQWYRQQAEARKKRAEEEQAERERKRQSAIEEFHRHLREFLSTAVENIESAADSGRDSVESTQLLTQRDAENLDGLYGFHYEEERKNPQNLRAPPPGQAMTKRSVAEFLKLVKKLANMLPEFADFSRYCSREHLRTRFIWKYGGSLLGTGYDRWGLYLRVAI